MWPGRLAGLGSKTGEMLRREPEAHGVHGEANLPVERLRVAERLFEQRANRKVLCGFELAGG